METVIRSSKSLTIYPSPAKDFITLKIPDSQYPATIQLLNQSGTVILTQIIKKQAQKINLTRLPEGLYIVTMNGKAAGKVIVQGR